MVCRIILFASKSISSRSLPVKVFVERAWDLFGAVCK